MKTLLPFLLLTISCFAQENAKEQLLDSLNNTREIDRGAFNLYIKKFKAEAIAGVFRDRESSEGFEPVNFTYNIYLPFQFDLNYVHLKAKDKLLKINLAFIYHHSKYGNYAFGLGNRFGFLLFRKTYLNYQIGIVWCEAIAKNTNDGINTMGFSLQHQISVSHAITKHLELSANIVHISDGNLFPGVNNTQDVLGIGIGYQF